MALYYLLLILIAGCAAVSIVVSIYFRARAFTLSNQLQKAKQSMAEGNVFSDLFSKNVRTLGDSVNWMNITARYVADAVDAVGLCIFRLDESKQSLTLTGSAGRIPRNLQTVQSVSQEGSLKDPDTGVKQLTVLEQVIFLRKEILLGSRQEAQLNQIDIDPHCHVNTMMAIPLTADGQVVGMVCAINRLKRSGLPFDLDLFRRLKLMSSHILLARNIMRVYENLSEQQRISQELRFAQLLQKSLLPRDIPDWGQFQIDATSRSSKEVSGDFYDYVEIDNDRLLVVIGDACGKGIPACMIMAMTRSFIRSNASRFTTLKDMVLELNKNLNQDMGDGRYITLGMCLLNKKESTLEYIRAGHTEMLVFVRNHIRCISPEGSGVGLIPNDWAEFDTFCMEMTPDMEILLFTDGINEATNPKGEYFGIDRIKDEFLTSCREREQPGDTIARVMGAVDEFSQDPSSQADDQTVVIIRHG